MKVIKADKKTQSPNERNLAEYYATFHNRLMATVIDIILLTPVILFIMDVREMPEAAQQLNQMISSGQFSQQQIQAMMSDYYFNQGGLKTTLLYTLLDTCIVGSIYVLFWRKLGATPGKYLFGMHIVDAKTLKKPSLRQEIIRFLGYIVSSIPLFLGFLWIVFDKEKQGWHDKLAGTITLYKKPHDEAWKKKSFKRQTIIILIFLAILALYISTQSPQ